MLFNRSAAALAALLFFGIVTIWVPERWPLGLFQAGVCGIGIVWAIRMLIRPFRLRFSALMLPPAAIALWAVVQLAAGRTVYPWLTWIAVLDWCVSFALLFLTFNCLIDFNRRRSFLRALLIFGFLLSIVSTVQMFTTDKIFWIFPSGYTTFVLGPFVNRNLYAAFLELILPLALVEAIGHGRPSPVFGFMSCVIFASGVAGASRAGTALMAVEVLAVLGIAAARRMVSPVRAAALLAVFVCVTAGLSAIAGGETLWSRLHAADIFEGRQELVRSSLEMARQRPLWGFGFGTWATVYPAHAMYDDGQAVRHSHSDWAEWAAEGGAPLALIFLGMALVLFRPAVRSIWGVGLLAFLAHCAVDYPIQQKPVLAGWFFVFVGALAAANTVRKAYSARSPLIGSADVFQPPHGLRQPSEHGWAWRPTNKS